MLLRKQEPSAAGQDVLPLDPCFRRGTDGDTPCIRRGTAYCPYLDTLDTNGQGSRAQSPLLGERALGEGLLRFAPSRQDAKKLCMGHVIARSRRRRGNPAQEKTTPNPSRKREGGFFHPLVSRHARHERTGDAVNGSSFAQRRKGSRGRRETIPPPLQGRG